MDNHDRKSIRKTQVLDDTLDKFDLIDIYRAFHSKRMNELMNFTFFSSANETLSRVDHI